jgi:hypothetical protein
MNLERIVRVRGQLNWRVDHAGHSDLEVHLDRISGGDARRLWDDELEIGIGAIEVGGTKARHSVACVVFDTWRTGESRSSAGQPQIRNDKRSVRALPGDFRALELNRHCTLSGGHLLGAI